MLARTKALLIARGYPPDVVNQSSARETFSLLCDLGNREVEVSRANEAAKPIAERAARAKQHLLLNVDHYGVDRDLGVLDDQGVLDYYEERRAHAASRFPAAAAPDANARARVLARFAALDAQPSE